MQRGPVTSTQNFEGHTPVISKPKHSDFLSFGEPKYGVGHEQEAQLNSKELRGNHSFAWGEVG